MRLRFRDLHFDLGARSLTRADRPVPLSPKAFSLLEVLVMRRPDAVSHEELRRTLWSDAADGGTTLARLVSEIRTALGDHDDAQPIVRTVHRFGYAFAEAAAEEERTTLPVGFPGLCRLAKASRNPGLRGLPTRAAPQVTPVAANRKASSVRNAPPTNHAANIFSCAVRIASAPSAAPESSPAAR